MRNRKARTDELLSKEEREAFEMVLREPNVTAAAALEWLREHGLAVSRANRPRHKRSFRYMLKCLRRWSGMAEEVARVAKESGIDPNEAVLTRFLQLMVERLIQAETDEELNAKELLDLLGGLKTAIGARQQIGKIRDEYERREREAVAAAQMAARSGMGAEMVVSEVRKVLGLSA